MEAIGVNQDQDRVQKKGDSCVGSTMYRFSVVGGYLYRSDYVVVSETLKTVLVVDKSLSDKYSRAFGSAVDRKYMHRVLKDQPLGVRRFAYFNCRQALESFRRRKLRQVEFCLRDIEVARAAVAAVDSVLGDSRNPRPVDSGFLAEPIIKLDLPSAYFDE